MNESSVATWAMRVVASPVASTVASTVADVVPVAAAVNVPTTGTPPRVRTLTDSPVDEPSALVAVMRTQYRVRGTRSGNVKDGEASCPSGHSTVADRTAPAKSSLVDRRATALPPRSPPSTVAVTVTERAVEVALVAETPGSEPRVAKVMAAEVTVPSLLVATNRTWCAVRGRSDANDASRDSAAAPVSASRSTRCDEAKSADAEISACTVVRRRPGSTVTDARAVVPPIPPDDGAPKVGSEPSVVNETAEPMTVPCVLTAMTRAWWTVRGASPVTLTPTSTGR